jgi:hypothetical protein
MLVCGIHEFDLPQPSVHVNNQKLYQTLYFGRLTDRYSRNLSLVLQSKDQSEAPLTPSRQLFVFWLSCRSDEAAFPATTEVVARIGVLAVAAVQLPRVRYPRHPSDLLPSSDGSILRNGADFKCVPQPNPADLRRLRATLTGVL